MDAHADASGAPKARRCLLAALASLVTLTAASVLLEGSTLTDDSGHALRLHFAPTRISNGTPNDLTTHPAWTNVDNYDGIPEVERFHQSLLHAACVAEENADAVIPWTLGTSGHQNVANGSASNGDVIVREDDPNLLEKLRQCPDVDIFLPRGLRGSGYCEDGVAYTKYLESRLLPMWVFQIKLFDPQLNRDVDYFDLCPNTPVIFFNHYWDGLTDLPRWPTDKPVWLMPNIEMFELTATHYWRADVVLCKTQTCFDRVSKWFDQEGNSRGTKVFYTKFTSSDQANFARMVLGDASIRSKDFGNVTLLHTAGTSVWKGTVQVVDCWLSQDNLPPVDVYIGDEAFAALFGSRYDSRIEYSSHPITLRRERLDPLSFARLVAESAFFLCPSIQEGYGHYLNQARASGGLVITTDAHPMNELIASSDMGLLVTTRRTADSGMLLGGAYQGEHGLRDAGDGLKAGFSSSAVCRAVKGMLATTTPEQRREMGTRARRAYYQDTKFFARAMLELRAFAKR